MTPDFINKSMRQRKVHTVPTPTTKIEVPHPYKASQQKDWRAGHLPTPKNSGYLKIDEHFS